jgi:hypothetical protein
MLRRMRCRSVAPLMLTIALTAAAPAAEPLKVIDDDEALAAVVKSSRAQLATVLSDDAREIERGRAPGKGVDG